MNEEWEVPGSYVISNRYLALELTRVRSVGAWLSFERGMPYVDSLALLGIDLFVVGIRIELRDWRKANG